MIAAKRILLLGATGFIGSEIAKRLTAQGHEVTGLSRDCRTGVHRLPQLLWVSADLRDLQTPADWQHLISDIDIVVNASGALQTGLRDDVGKVQASAIMALISAAEAKGIEFFLQISAAGASSASSEFMTSKAAADSALSTSSLQHCILRPGLVIGRNAFGGTEMMRMIAAIPLVAPSVQDARPIQCVALSDVIEAVSNAVTNPEKHQGRFDLVEAESRLLSQIIDLHRLWLGFPPPLFSVAAPLWAIKPVSLFADMLGWFGWRSPLRRNSIAALINGVSGHADESEPMLGRPALPLPMILQSVGSAGKADRWHARAALLFPFVLASLIVLWLGSAILGLTRADAAADYLVIAGMENSLAHALVLGGSLVDLAIAAALLFRPGLRIGLIAAILATLAYMIGSLFFRPDLWLDPLGPMLKTVPVLALCLICLATSDER